jgi:hypothetical protein
MGDGELCCVGVEVDWDDEMGKIYAKQFQKKYFILTELFERKQRMLVVPH